MGRPKGSRNKPKEEAPVEEFAPKPDMGDIKPPAPSENVCGCGHKRPVHYGGPKDWCNASGCNCQEFKS